MADFSPDAHWRDSARAVRFFVIDYRVAFPMMLFFLHIKVWTFALAFSCTVFLTILEHYGFTVVIFGRWLRSKLAGPRKLASPWWKE